MMEPAGHEDGATSLAAQGCHQRTRALDRLDSLVEALRDRAFLEPFEQGDTLAQRAFELQLATHCPLGNVGNAILQPCKIGQFVDTFLPDHGRVHVGDEQPRHLYLMVCNQQVGT